MKKVVLFLIIASGVFANPKTEAIGSIDTAKSLVSKEKYSKALEELNFAISKINEILSEKVSVFIPEPIEGFTISNKNAQSLGQFGAVLGSANAITATADYNNETTGAYMDINISVGGVLGQAGSLANFGKMFGAGSIKTKSIRIKGYTGTLEYDKENQSGSLSVQVGTKASVTIKGSSIDKEDLLISLAEKIDYDKLESDF